MQSVKMATLLLMASFLSPVHSQAQQHTREGLNKEPQATIEHQPNQISPVRGIKRPPHQPPAKKGQVEHRAIDGSHNHLQNENAGSSDQPLLRLADAEYSDQISQPAGENRASARLISNLVFSQHQPKPNSRRASDFLWQWGQFLDHDIDLTDGATPAESLVIPIPSGDTFFDPDHTGIATMVINRSLYDVTSGSNAKDPRQQMNEITAWIDGSNVYGSDDVRALALRTLDGSGKLKTSPGNLLPFNTSGLPNAGGDSDRLFLAGDVRANEQLGLTAVHTLFVREHNHQAERIRKKHPEFSDDEIYQRARKHIGAQMQVITYQEFLPLILGPNAIPPYSGYQPNIQTGIYNEFSTGAYRFGHTLLSSTLLRLDKQGQEIDAGHLPLRDAFFRPDRLLSEGGIDPILRGLARQQCQSIDSYVIDDVRNFLFGAPGAGGFDLAAINIQRGRDHGLPSYNNMRRALGLIPYQSFSQISSDIEVQQALEQAYGSVEGIDLWVGGLAEDHYQQAMVGEVFYHILRQQFITLRDGDRFWYQRTFKAERVEKLKQTRLSHIIRRNTQIKQELADNVFIAP